MLLAERLVGLPAGGEGFFHVGDDRDHQLWPSEIGAALMSRTVLAVSLPRASNQA